ncbi:PREDICTED: olfactory receptor 8H1-like [Nanorana parkeri]|uniref:olfactory receptor 8H1-like n=1 Tax=Nanorana parkeri TaxID=125878 RepID=UPI0008550356|nr:PREDICTED: olfactory receptor 8H1-like [Nanorana parkeri]
MANLADNGTTARDFQILAFFSEHGKQPLLFSVFLLIYLTGLLGNLIIITVTCADIHLHTPMYFFLCNLSFVDISYTTVTVPKLMDMLLTGDNSISFIQCFAQMFFFTFVGSIEVLLLSSMAYDRYIAICNPLKYHLIMNRRNCVLLSVAIWIPGCINSALVTLFASTLPLCYSNKIQQFFCNVKALAQISCPDARFDALIYVEVIVLGLCPLLLSMSSYMKIIKVVLRMSASGRRKTFSTCASHLIVLLMFYGTILFMYMKPTSRYSGELDQTFSVMYAAIAPMLNPLIYSLRNKEVKNALIRITRYKNDSV